MKTSCEYSPPSCDSSKVKIKKKRKGRIDPKGKKFLLYVNKYCPRRSIDTSRYYKYLNANEWQPTKKINKANLIVLYTCGFCPSAEKRSLITIEKILAEQAEGSTFIVTGCLTKINPAVLNGKYRVIPPQEIDVLNDVIDANIKLSSVSDSNHIFPKIKNLETPFKIKLSRYKVNYWPNVFLAARYYRGKLKYEGIWNIKIADGCLGNCSFCPIRIAAGKLKSKNPDTIIEEFQKGLEQGFKKFKLLGTDSGAYGRDIDTNIVQLLGRIFAMDGDYKLSMIDFNPRWLVRYYDELVPLLEKNKHRLAYMAMPFQSGSDNVLRRMRRPYKSAELKMCFQGLISRVPNLSIHTHVMAGFPGETDDDFDETLKFVSEVNFDWVTIYLYRDRPGIESTQIIPKVPEEIKVARAKTLKKLCNEKQGKRGFDPYIGRKRKFVPIDAEAR